MRLGGDNSVQQHRRHKRRRTLRAFATFLFITLLLLVLAGIAYTWYIAQQNPVDEAPLPEASTQNKLPEPAKIPEKNAQVGVAVQTFTSPVNSGDNTSLSIKTLPGAACSVVFTYNDDKTRSTDTGLIPKIADDYGFVEWTWQVSPSVRDGTWPVEVTCAHLNKSAYSRSDLVVKRQ